VRLLQIVQDAKALLALEPEELAGVLLAHLNALPPNDRSRLNRHDFFNNPQDTFADYPSANREPLARAFMEAWA
jgi:hypothetical protein